MQGPSKDTVQRKPKLGDKLKHGINNIKAKFSRAPSPQPSRTATPGLSAQGVSSKTGGGAGVAAISEDTADAPSKLNKDKGIGTNPTPEWEAWNIDGDAITQLREWGAARGDSNWFKLAETIDRSLKSKTLDALKGFIPDSPIPARTLVKALLNLVELGINIPLIQKRVYEFAQEAIQYISTLVGVVGEELSVKGDLNKICEAVNEICLWAKERVSVKSVSVDDLEDWKFKLTRAKETFLATTVTKIRVEQEIAGRMAFIEKKLASHIAAKYEHTDQSKSICADGTRVELLADIKQWLLPQPSNDERIFWVTGIPGSGKSTLSATIVENLRQNDTPVSAQFFISRNIPETIDPTKIIPTIAQQLAISSPTVARVLEMALKNGYPASRDDQVTSLLLDPIRELSKSHDVVVILIDALDELKDASGSVMKILSRIAPIDCDLPNNIRFIITSRPEHWADISTSKKLNHAVFKQYSLATKLSVTEVHNFVVARMREVVTNRMELTPDEPDWHHWPHPDQLQRLSNKANGLFHYAATALHWIEQRIGEDGTACRESAFQRFSEDGLDELEGLYKLILTSWEDVYKPTKANDRRATRLGGFQHVMGAILVLREPLLIREIVALLSDIPKVKFDVINFLQQMRSVLIPGTTTSFYDATPQLHKSFRDYTMSERAPPGFRILARDAHFKIARSCLDIIAQVGSQCGIGYEYAVTHWYVHLQKAVWEGATCDDERMWTLLGKMVNEEVVSVWMGKGGLMNMFESVATTGWQLLEQQKMDWLKLVPISNMLVEIKLAALREEEAGLLAKEFGLTGARDTLLATLRAKEMVEFSRFVRLEGKSRKPVEEEKFAEEVLEEEEEEQPLEEGKQLELLRTLELLLEEAEEEDVHAFVLPHPYSLC